MKKIFNTIIEALQEAEIKHCVAEEEKSCVDFCIDGEKATYHVHLYAEEDQELLICATVFPIKVPQDRISEMCVLINRINDSNLVTSPQLWMMAQSTKRLLQQSCAILLTALRRTTRIS